MPQVEVDTDLTKIWNGDRDAYIDCPVDLEYAHVGDATGTGLTPLAADKPAILPRNRPTWAKVASGTALVAIHEF